MHGAICETMVDKTHHATFTLHLLGTFPSRLRNRPRFFCTKSRRSFVVDVRRLAAPPNKKVPKPQPCPCGVELRCRTISFSRVGVPPPLAWRFVCFWPPAAGVCPARWQAGRRKCPKNSAGHILRNHCFLATELQGCNEVLLCSARGRPLAPACADAWRDHSNALHNTNDTDVANSLAHATRNHPKKSAS